MQNRNHSLIWYLFISAIVIIIIVGIFLAGRFSALPENDSAVNTALSRNAASTARSRASSPHTYSRRSSDSSSENRVEQFSEQIEDIISQNDQLDRTRSWVDFIDGLSGDEFPDALTAFQENGVTRERMGEYALLLNAWAKIDPLAALDYTTANTTTPFARKTILTTWAQNDQEAAIAWAKNNYKGDGANPWLVGVIRGIAGNDIERATELMNTLPYSRESREALAAILPAVIDMEPEAARKWIDAISNERLRTGAMDHVYKQFARSSFHKNPSLAISYIGRIQNEATRNNMYSRTLNAWMHRDESAAFDWIESNQLPLSVIKRIEKRLKTRK